MPKSAAMTTTAALPPETLEGWYASHQTFALDHAALRAADPQARSAALDAARAVLRALTADRGEDEGWSVLAPLVGSTSDLLIMHLRPTLAALADAERAVKTLGITAWMRAEYAFLSVTEAGLYHVTAQLAREAVARGGGAGDEAYREALAARAESERAVPHTRRRLYPPIPSAMPWLCFYPMSKRRAVGQNWYALSLDERSRLMQTHGTTGRRYAGKVVQIITGAIGFDAWEWGVTLFAGDPLDVKRLVTDMRFDEVSAQYAEFGEFWFGRVTSADAWVDSLVRQP